VQVNKAVFYIFVFFLLSMAISETFAQTPNFIVTAESPQAQGGEILVETIFTVDILIENISENDYCGGAFSFIFYSPDLSIAVCPHIDVQGEGPTENIEYLNGWDGFFELVNEIYPFGYDGNLPDSINFQLLGTNCLVPGTPNQAYIRFSFRSYETGTFCIDSLDHPDPSGDYDWLFAPYFTPVFNGPYCWEIVPICFDGDNDGFGDPGHPENTCEDDNCPAVYNPGQEDGDNDGIGDACDDCTDSDDDGFGNPGAPNPNCAEDNCPFDYNPEQEDYDGDGIGDVCDECNDRDGDGFGDPGFIQNVCPDDNCPFYANSGQEDDDGDGVGNSCYCQGITPGGTHIVVNLCGFGRATFQTVTSVGVTSVKLRATDPAPDTMFMSIPESMPVYYEVGTNAHYDDSIYLEIFYSDAGLDADEESKLKLFRYSGTEWIDETTTLLTALNRVSGWVDSLGYFKVAFEPLICGDVNDDGNVDILDIISLVNYKFKGGPAPVYERLANVNCDSSINVLDIIYLVQFKFKQGPPPNCCPLP